MFFILPTARFTDLKPQQNIIADSSGIIDCSAEGTPTPQIEWRRLDKVPLDKGRFTQLSTGSLYINLIHVEDNGTYICTFRQTKGSKRVTTQEQTINVLVISE